MKTAREWAEARNAETLARVEASNGAITGYSLIPTDESYFTRLGVSTAAEIEAYFVKVEAQEDEKEARKASYDRNWVADEVTEAPVAEPLRQSPFANLANLLKK